MDYRHFRRLLERKVTEERSDLALLQDFVRDYPYCQTGHLLLSGAMHVQDHVGYDRQLRRTAACIPDRASLFNLIHGSSAVAAGSPLAIEPSPFSIDEVHPVAQAHPLVDDAASDIMGDAAPAAPPLSESITGMPSLTDLHDYHAGDQVTAGPLPEQSTDDPQEIFRRKLEMMLGESEEPVPENPTVSSSTVVPAVIESAPAEKPEPTGLEELEIGHALEENILKELEKLPAIPASKPDQSAAVVKEKEPRDFFSWLSTTSGNGFGKFELLQDSDDLPIEVVAASTVSVPTASSEATEKRTDLIDRFLKTEPRIVPQPKAEFFNPSVQAKRSVEEHEDLVSETLAKIYADQGNLMKARTAYERLRLLHPEKNAYFAALVRKIDNQLNSTSEDL